MINWGEGSERPRPCHSWTLHKANSGKHITTWVIIKWITWQSVAITRSACIRHRADASAVGVSPYWQLEFNNPESSRPWKVSPFLQQPIFNRDSWGAVKLGQSHEHGWEQLKPERGINRINAGKGPRHPELWHEPSAWKPSLRFELLWLHFYGTNRVEMGPWANNTSHSQQPLQRWGLTRCYQESLQEKPTELVTCNFSSPLVIVLTSPRKMMGFLKGFVSLKQAVH